MSEHDDFGNSAISKPELAKKIDIGKRMPSFKVLNHADARPWHFQDC